MTEQVEIPVLLLIFNRPQKTKRVFEAVRQSRPHRLFLAADGPRLGHSKDVELCREARRVVGEVDWPCTVETLFRDRNLGCRRGVEEGISWFFSRVGRGIILEDDCVPSSSFFTYCSELLDRFGDDDTVMMVGGTNQLGSLNSDGSSYVFTRQYNQWGWATWGEAWNHYHSALGLWHQPDTRSLVRSRMHPRNYELLERRVDAVTSGQLDTWDFIWHVALHANQALATVPAHNLVANIGFDETATHTKNQWSPDADISTGDLTPPLRHPPKYQTDPLFERAISKRNRPWRTLLVNRLPHHLHRPARAMFHRITALRPRRFQRTLDDPSSVGVLQ